MHGISRENFHSPLALSQSPPLQSSPLSTPASHSHICSCSLVYHCHLPMLLALMYPHTLLCTPVPSHVSLHSLAYPCSPLFILVPSCIPAPSCVTLHPHIPPLSHVFPCCLVYSHAVSCIPAPSHVFLCRLCIPALSCVSVPLNLSCISIASVSVYHFLLLCTIINN